MCNVNDALVSAIEDGDVHRVAVLLRSGGDPNMAAQYGRLPLCVAVDSDGRLLAALLLACGANADAREPDGGRNALFYAHEPETARLLINFGADVRASAEDGTCPLHSVSNLQVIDVILHAGADPDVVDKSGVSPLLGAISDSYAEKVLLLLVHGASADLRNGEGLTPLHRAVELADGYVCSLLLRFGADPNAVDSRGMTPLHYLAYGFAMGGPDELRGITELILASGGDPARVDEAGCAALAIEGPSGDVLREVVRRGDR